MSESTSPRHHAVIAGTGRAGTTFLVQFLAACGVDTGESTVVDDRAHAGLEIPLNHPEAPYLTKDPWLYTYCDDLDLDSIAVDVVILPMRDLTDAANSRLIQEKAHVLENMPEHFARATSYGHVIGGSIYSLETTDLERLLAVGFYRVLQWAVRHELTICLVDFPRLVEDGDYLIDALWPWLQTYCSKEEARAALAATAQPQLVTTMKRANFTPTEADFAAMQRVLRDAERTISLLQDNVQFQLEEQARLRQTKSWKVTAPIRWLRRHSS